MGKKGEKKYPAHQIARKKYSWWREITAPPPPQELNGRPLSEERKIAQKAGSKFARIAHDWQLNMKVSGSLEWPGVLEKQSLWCFV